jgi:hypothetical protein
MNDKALRIYLQDHLAGSVMGIRLARNCETENRPSAVSGFVSKLLPEIEDDQHTLEEVIDRVGGKPSRTVRAAAWMVERMTLLKFNQALRGHPDLKRFEQLEGLLVGVRGKQALWHTLHAIQDERLADVDFESLAERASNQIERIERHRIEAGYSAFRDGECADGQPASEPLTRSAAGSPR